MTIEFEPHIGRNNVLGIPENTCFSGADQAQGILDAEMLYGIHSIIGGDPIPIFGGLEFDVKHHINGVVMSVIRHYSHCLWV